MQAKEIIMANIKKYTKKDGSTAYQFSVYLGVDEKTGKKKRTTRRGFRTKKEAKQSLARLELGDDAPKSKSYKKYTTFRDVYELWWENYVQKGLKPSTVANTEIFFRCHILPVFGNKTIRSITPFDCQKVVNVWYKDFTAGSVYKNYANAVFEFAKKTLKEIDTNPMDDIETPRKKRKNKVNHADKFYTKQELTDFLDWLQVNRPKKEYAIMRVLAFTGLRKSEVLALNWSDIDFNNGTLRVNKTVMRVKNDFFITTPKTNESNRVISLDHETLKILKRWKLTQKTYFLERGIIIKHDDKQLVFTNNHNGLLYTRYPFDIINRYPDKQITPHGFRHTHATLLLNSGVSANDVAKRLGHATAKMTLDVYGHPSTDDKFVADQFASILKG